jgi:hypothetical protein
MNLNPDIWGPHYWFFLHTITMCYPRHPNAVTKKKYYEFISNLPLFIPVENISSHFSTLLDKYPVTPYLDSREEFIKWMHFIHNKINEKLEKPKISLHEFYEQYYEQYKSNDIKIRETSRWKEKLIYTIMVITIVFLMVYLYNKSY